MRHGTSWQHITPQRTETYTVVCPVCYRPRQVRPAVLAADYVRVTCSAACHAVWREVLRAFLRCFPDLARKPDAISYYVQREVLPRQTVELYYETIRKEIA